MSTVAQVADKVFREYLSVADDVPVLVSLSAGVGAAATSWPFASSMLAPDELDMLAPGVVVEAWSGEQALVVSADLANNVLTVARGFNGTEALAHDAGALLTVSPMFPRRTVLDAVKDEVSGLYPSLWAKQTVTVSGGYEFVEVPAEVEIPVGLAALSDSGRRVSVAYDYMPDFPPSSSGKAIVVRRDGARGRSFGFGSGTSFEGRDLFFTFRGRFARPDRDDDDLTRFGVLPHWERIVAVGAAAAVTAGRDLGGLSAQYVTEALEREALPPGEAGQVRNRLIQMRSLWLEEASRQLRASDPHPVVVQPLGAY